MESDAQTEAEARQLIQQVLAAGASPGDMGALGLWSEEAERFIRRETQRLSYEPKLPHGGLNEKKIVEKLMKLSRRRDWAGAGRATIAAERWAAIDGWYYKREPLLQKRDEEDYAWFKGCRDNARTHRDWELKWFAELMLDGLPRPVADFKMECRFLLKKPDGTSLRLVTLRNVVGEVVEMLELPPDFYAQPSHFREWLLTAGNFSWKAGEKELQDLHEDINRNAAWRVVEQVPAVGWYPLKGYVGEFGSADGAPVQRGLWFMGDIAYDPLGRPIFQDEHGIYWFDEKGYLLADRGRESRFLQEKPLMRPGFQLDVASLDLEEPYDPADGKSVLSAFFRETCYRLDETLGGREGSLAMGSLLAYAAAPELFAKYRAFPGIWIHGQASSGKSTLIGWLMSVWGFNQHSGFGLISNTTTVGIQMLAEQYSNLPVWLDEFRDMSIDPYKLGIIRSCCYRDEQAKFKVEREIRTSFLVSGEGTTQDAATRSRFPHVQVAESKRRGNHLGWFQSHEQYFFAFARYLLEHRIEFARLVLGLMSSWMVDTRMNGVNERSKLIHGVPYAAWTALSMMLHSHDMDEQAGFREFMQDHAGSSAADVKSEFNVSIFWTDLMNAYKGGALELKYFKIKLLAALPHAPGAPNQPNWKRYALYIDPEPVIAQLQIFLAKGRGTLALKRKDLRDQLSKNPYWLGSKCREWMNGASIYVWGFDLDQHPMGYQAVPDDDAAYIEFMRTGHADPRRGPLFAIVHAVLQRESEAQPDL